LFRIRGFSNKCFSNPVLIPRSIFLAARNLDKVFKEHLDINLLKRQISALKVEKQAELVLWKKV